MTRKDAGLAAAVFAAAAACYAGSLGNGFAWDDALYVQGNPFLDRPGAFLELLSPEFYLRPQPVLAASRPVFLASLLFDRALFGSEAFGHHLSNLLLHAANSVWVFALAAWLFPKSPAQSVRAAGAGLLFAVHPLQTEAVNAVSFRPDLLAAFFVFAGLWASLRAGRAAPGASAPWAAAGLLAFGAGLLSKESAAVLPLAVLAARAYFPDKAFTRRRAAAVVAVQGLVFAAFLGFWAQRFQYRGLGWRPFEDSARAQAEAAARSPSAAEPGAEPRFVFDPGPTPWSEALENGWARTWTMAGILGDYLRWMIVPPRPVVDRAPAVVSSPAEPRALAGLAVLALAGAWAWFARKRRPVEAFASAWCLLSLLPASGVVPLYNPVAERYAYLAAAGASWGMAAAFAGWAGASPRRAPWKFAAAAVLLLSHASRTYARGRDWRDDLALFSSAPAGAAVSHRLHYNKAKALWKAGRVEEALAEYQAALRLNPRYAEAWLNLGALLNGLGRPEEARRSYDKAVLFAVHDPLPAFYYGRFLQAQGQPAAARRMYERALAVAPDFSPARAHLDALR